jgi:beta-galactosidase
MSRAPLPLLAVAVLFSIAHAQLPDGVKAVWDPAKAFRESTLTRERLSINGLWQWQPASGEALPKASWGYLRVPEPWPSGNARTTSRFLFPHPAWAKTSLRTLTSAWYQREVSIPANWTGRRITLDVAYLNSYAAVYLDGKPAGELRYPAGELDLTALVHPGHTHLLTLRVDALPLKAVMLSFRDSAAARTIEGIVARKGLCGDISLVSTPAGPRISDITLDTSVRKWQIHFDTAVTTLDPNASYVLQARITDGNRPVKEFSRTFKSTDLHDARLQQTESWHPEKLWDTITPQNQYQVSVSLLDTHGKVLDIAHPVRFGFREFWIDGRDFYLNGSRIYLSAIPIDNAQQSPLMASYEAARATLQRYKSFGINFVYTHNYGCEPGAHLDFEEILRAADDEGVLLSFSQPHFSHYEWTGPDADQSNGYAQHAAFYTRVAGNHPSIVFYSMSHNGTGYSEDMNPDMIDGVHSDRDQWALRNSARAERAEAIVHKLDPRRIVYHHASGNLGPMHVSNFYGNWIPIQEMSDWFEHWATTGIKPLFTCEYSVPFMWDWGMYRGWYKGKREFGSAVVPWEFSVAEWDAQFFGDRAYQVTEEEKAVLRWESVKFKQDKGWFRWDPPQSLNTQVFDDRFRVIAMYLTDNWRAFRTWGMSANSPWEYGSYWKQASGNERERTDLPLAIDWDRLQRPGPRPAYVDEPEARDQLAFHAADYQPTLAAQALYRNNMPLLGYIAGKPAAFTGKDHNFLPGETVEKQLIIINNSRRPVTCDIEWSFLSTAHTTVKLPTGDQRRVPLKFALPADLAPGRHEINATFRFSTGETQQDSFDIDVLPAPTPLQTTAKIALFDPERETAHLLDTLAIRYQTVDAAADLSTFDTLIVGKGALSLQASAPGITRVRGGLKVIVFEQTGEILEKRLGFRVAEYGLRQVFKRVPDHPLLAGIPEENLRDWRGSATTVPPRLTYQKPPLFNAVPTVEWAGLPETRVWRNGNRGNVASALIEKPAYGDFLSILDGGYSLQYTSLLEHREGNGLMLFCQTDVTGRTEPDPAADTLLRNILRYVAAWKAQPTKDVVYAGGQEGQDWLKSAGIPFIKYNSGVLSPDRVLIVGPGNRQKITHTGSILALGLDEAQAALLPVKVTMARKEYISTYFPPFAAHSSFAGISPAEVHNRSPRTLPLIAGGVLAETPNAVFSQLAPWQFAYTADEMNLKRTFRHVSVLTMRLLANLGVSPPTKLLANFAQPVQEKDQRWLQSLYADVPQEWDDPYRFFRW